ncbi:Bug family tripartite tricarboxylate transporter substrate binding protein [Roseomonas sp. BN140053]|uniref:Bug family tripartite tricarboxylate transporter substrate binding protein n=1 Tax=Roseomonas sp. BN140053 TaxID=3391898 RepID=UPI0039E9D805
MIIPFRRRAVLAGALALPGLATPAVLRAQGADTWPRRPIRIVVPYAPGGATDSSVRAISDKLGAALGQNLVIENRSGGSGTVGGSAAALSAPDGYTFLMEGIPATLNPFILRNTAFDYRTAFTPVTQVTRLPLVLAVKNDLPARNVAEFVAMAKEKPDTLSCGHAGNGTGAHLAGVLLQGGAGISLVPAPYRGGADAARDLAAGSLDSGTLSLLNVAPLAEGGRVRLLAVFSPQRTPLKPDLPTIGESGVPGVVLTDWMGLFAVTGTPPAIIDKLQSAVAAVLREPDVRQRLAQLGGEGVGSTPAEFAAFVAQGRTEGERLVREGKIEMI